MTPILSVRDLTVTYRTGHGVITAVDRVGFDLARGETLGIVGESGCGKSTLARALVGLVRPTGGSIHLLGTDVARLPRRAWRPFRKNIQLVFQDPEGSLNPRLTVGRIIEEPLLVQGRISRADRQKRVLGLLRSVGLPEEAAERYPHEFSGGQRQRVGIARAVALEPDIIVADEPVSALDVSVQAQIINLLNDLQRNLGLSYVFISHDLAVVHQIADRVIVMYLGRVVETADHEDLWVDPLHPYTRALFALIPRLDRSRPQKSRGLLDGEPPNPLDPPSGCTFRTRCAFATAVCAEREPVLRAYGQERAVACHHVKQIAPVVPSDFVRRGFEGGR